MIKLNNIFPNTPNPPIINKFKNKIMLDKDENGKSALKIVEFVFKFLR